VYEYNKINICILRKNYSIFILLDLPGFTDVVEIGKEALHIIAPH